MPEATPDEAGPGADAAAPLIPDIAFCQPFEEEVSRYTQDVDYRTAVAVARGWLGQVPNGASFSYRTVMEAVGNTQLATVFLSMGPPSPFVSPDRDRVLRVLELPGMRARATQEGFAGPLPGGPRTLHGVGAPDPNLAGPAAGGGGWGCPPTFPLPPTESSAAAAAILGGFQMLGGSQGLRVPGMRFPGQRRRQELRFPNAEFGSAEELLSYGCVGTSQLGWGTPAKAPGPGATGSLTDPNADWKARNKKSMEDSPHLFSFQSAGAWGVQRLSSDNPAMVCARKHVRTKPEQDGFLTLAERFRTERGVERVGPGGPNKHFFEPGLCQEAVIVIAKFLPTSVLEELANWGHWMMTEEKAEPFVNSEPSEDDAAGLQFAVDSYTDVLRMRGYDAPLVRVAKEYLWYIRGTPAAILIGGGKPSSLWSGGE